MSLTESEIQRDIKNYLQKTGWKVIRNHTQGVKYSRGRGTNPNAGMPDLLSLRAGEYVWIEVKTPSGKLSIIQLMYIARLRNHGAKVIIATCVDDVIFQL